MGENADALKDMAAQFASMLQIDGEKGRQTWTQLHGKLAEIAAAAGSDDPRTAGHALLAVAKDASNSSSQALMRSLEESVSKVNPNLLKYLVLLVADKLDLSPLCDSGNPVHMVDGGKKFCHGNVDQIMECSAELPAPDAYTVVSVVGAQNSGKSYLLNRLFGTKFPELDVKLGWPVKTTRGIMMSRCIGPSLLLLDVEGYDGTDDEKDTSFEKQAALFVLAVSDLMIVNINIADIGRGQGSGTLLFRTIFQERPKIGGAGCTTILVVIRDYNIEAPLDILRSKVLERLQQIWKSVNVVPIKFEDYIKVEIFGMPHKDSADFPKQVTVLRRRLSKNRSAKVPASGFSESSSILWNAITENRKLNIPSHQVLIAKFDCGRMVKRTLEALGSQEDYKLLKAEQSPSYFKNKADAVLGGILARYDKESEMYDPKIRIKERKYLEEELCKIFTDASRELTRKVQENTLEHYKGVFDRNTTNMEAAKAELYGEEIVSACIKTFISSFEDHKFIDSTYLNGMDGELKTKMQSHITIHVLGKKEEQMREKYEQLKEGLIKGTILVAQLVLPAAPGAAIGHFLR